jgi:TonB family protein
MVQKRWLLVSTSVAIFALVILYIRNNGSGPPQHHLPNLTPEVAPPPPSEAAKPGPPPTPKFGVPIFSGNVADAVHQAVRVVRPEYTKAALNAHYEGEVKVNFILGRDGMAHNIAIVNSPGYGMDQNIIGAMKQWLWDSVFIHEDQKVTITIVFKPEH